MSVLTNEELKAPPQTILEKYHKIAETNLELKKRAPSVTNTNEEDSFLKLRKLLAAIFESSKIYSKLGIKIELLKPLFDDIESTLSLVEGKLAEDRYRIKLLEDTIVNEDRANKVPFFRPDNVDDLHAPGAEDYFKSPSPNMFSNENKQEGTKVDVSEIPSKWIDIIKRKMEKDNLDEQKSKDPKKQVKKKPSPKKQAKKNPAPSKNRSAKKK